MLRPILVTVALSAVGVLGISSVVHARPATNSHGCSNSETMRIPLRELNKCALDGGSMKCTASGYECCYDNGTYCEWSPYSSRVGAGANVVAPTGDKYLPPSPVRPPVKPPVGPYSPPKNPPQGPKVTVGAGPMVVAQPNRPAGPRIK